MLVTAMRRKPLARCNTPHLTGMGGRDQRAVTGCQRPFVHTPIRGTAPRRTVPRDKGQRGPACDWQLPRHAQTRFPFPNAHHRLPCAHRVSRTASHSPAAGADPSRTAPCPPLPCPQRALPPLRPQVRGAGRRAPHPALQGHHGQAGAAAGGGRPRGAHAQVAAAGTWRARVSHWIGGTERHVLWTC